MIQASNVYTGLNIGTGFNIGEVVRFTSLKGSAPNVYGVNTKSYSTEVTMKYDLPEIPVDKYNLAAIVCALYLANEDKKQEHRLKYSKNNITHYNKKI